VLRYSKHTRGCCKNVLHRFVVSLPGSARNTNGIKNTPEGVVTCKNVLHRSVVYFTRQCKEDKRHSKHTKGCCKNVLHRSVVYFTRQCKEHKRHSKHTKGCCKNVLHRSAVSLPGCARNTNGIKNTPEGVVRMCCTGRCCFTRLCKEHPRH
jgi:uncharacterized protein YwbE